MMLTNLQKSGLLRAANALRFKERAWLLDAFTVTTSCTHSIDYDVDVRVGSVFSLEATSHPEIMDGDVVMVNNKVKAWVAKHSDDSLSCTVIAKKDEPCFDLLGVFELTVADMQECFGNNTFSKTNIGLTTVGRFLVNTIVLAYPFENKIFEYVNKNQAPKKFIDTVKNALLEKQITVEQFEKFINYVYFIGHLNELNTPSMTTRFLQTNPKVAEFKKKFILENKDKLHDPLVIQKLESELIRLDKEWIGDDHSEVLMNGLGKKSWAVQRKKMFLTIGGIPAFDTVAGDMDFIGHSLSEGHTPQTLPSIANEIRKGSYERGVETAKGGTETKFIMRVFQDAVITEDDCGTKRTIEVDCKSGHPGPKDFIGRTIRVNGKDVVVTRENCDELIKGKVIHLYSPLTCETVGNFCYKCCGAKSKDLNAKMLGVEAIRITSKFTTVSMKNMHGTALEVRNNKLEDILL
jgi:hypothetical protein